MKKSKVFFFDRDGTINKDNRYVGHINNFEFLPCIFDVLKLIDKMGFKIVVITNQSGIGRGYYTYDHYQDLTNWMLDKLKEEGILIFDVLHCPHLPEDKCLCRKPKTGLLKELKLDIDFSNSWIIGDNESDIEFGINANIGNKIIIDYEGALEDSKTKADFIIHSICDLKKILKNEKGVKF